MDELEELFTLRTYAKRSLSVIKELAKAFGNPQESFKTIHIAGSNGKGTIATQVAKGLQLQGYRTALFTSPHILSYCERMSINGQYISKEYVLDTIKEIKKVSNSLFFFEYTFMIALLYFRDMKVDFAVIECGLGGTLDTTNIITPLLSIITSISLEHTDILGETLDRIAENKAGIIKKGIPVIVGPSASLFPIKERAAQLNAPLTSSRTMDDISTAALEHFSVDQTIIDRALLIKPPCRFELIVGDNSNPKLLIDVAHNPAALNYLFSKIKTEWPDKTIHLLVGLGSQKDHKGFLSLAAGMAEYISLFPSDNPLLVSANMLNDVLDEVGCINKSIEGFEAAIERADSQNALLVVCGSFYLIGGVLKNSMTSSHEG